MDAGGAQSVLKAELIAVPLGSGNGLGGLEHLLGVELPRAMG